jgi:hypothetical protein
MPKIGFSWYSMNMKIDGPKSSSDIAKKKEAKKTSTGDGAFQSMVSGGGETVNTAQTGLSAGIASVDVLLAAQAIEDSTQKSTKQRMKGRASDILDKLNDLKVAMMSGGITLGHMVSIADVVATHREAITDPELTSILDEIDLRAHVELAKLNMTKKHL